MSNDLTDQQFWIDYWGKINLPVFVDFKFKNDRVIAEEILNSIDKRGQSVFEIGCAPGKWLSLLAKERSCNVTGIEYVHVAAEKTIENLHIQNITNFNIIHGDFFNYHPDQKFDIVLSLGFIEHFDNFEKVLNDKLAILAPQGQLIIGIPRFRGINYFLQLCIDKFIDLKLLPSHNLTPMCTEVINDFADKNNLSIICNKYIGGFEPGLFPVGQISNTYARVTIKIIMRLLTFIFGSFNSKYTSSYQISILRKK
jgi:SAM-dependent methyltransferase